MTHFSVGIIVPPQFIDDYEAYVERQMAPHDENLIVATYRTASGELINAWNPDGHWNEYEINGESHGWTGDIFSVEEMLSSGNYLSLPTSLVTPDGIWHDSGPMSYQRMLYAFHGHSVVLLNAHD